MTVSVGANKARSGSFNSKNSAEDGHGHGMSTGSEKSSSSGLSTGLLKIVLLLMAASLGKSLRFFDSLVSNAHFYF